MSNHIRKQMDDYLNGDLSHAAREAFEFHLEDCRSCRTALHAARETSQVLGWLMTSDSPPQPGPEFYYRVQAAIERKQAQGWLGTLAATLQPRLVYPLAMMALLLVAWALSVPRTNAGDAWDEVEYPSAEFAQMTFSNDLDEGNQDRMMENLVELPEEF